MEHKLTQESQSILINQVPNTTITLINPKFAKSQSVIMQKCRKKDKIILPLDE